MLFYRPGDPYFKYFTTRLLAGGVSDADETPVAVASRNGADDENFVLTTTKVDTGRYKVTGTVPAYSVNDRVEISVQATVGSITEKAIVDNFIIHGADAAIHSVQTIQSGLATSANQTTINNNILAVPAAVWAVSTRTLTSFGTLVASVAAAVWDYLTSAILTIGSIGKLLKDNVDGKVSERGMILPVMTGRVYSATIIQDRKIEIVQGNTPRIPFDLNFDYSGWTPYFGAKAKLSDTEYVIAPKAAAWSDATKGQGYVDLTAADTATCGKFIGELQLRSGDNRLSPIMFTLVIVGSVISG